MTDENTENQEIWMVVGAMSWGKSDNFRDAFTNWLKNVSISSYVPCEVGIHRFTGTFDPKLVTIDGMGGLEFPRAAKWVKRERFAVTRKMADAYNAWSYLCDDIEYSADFDKVFAE